MPHTVPIMKQIDQESVQTVSLVVPKDRTECATWLATQSPETVADMLEATEVLFSTVSAVTQQTPLDIVRAHNQELGRLRKMQADEMSRVTSEIRDTIYQQCTEEADVRHRNHQALLESQLKEAREQIAQTQSIFETEKRTNEDIHERAQCNLAKERDSYKRELDNIKSTMATYDSDLQRRYEAKVSDLKEEFEKRQTLQKESYVQGETHLKAMLDEVRRNAEATRAHDERRIEMETMRYEQVAKQLEEAVNKHKEEIHHLQSNTFARVETIFGSLCGNSAKKGDLGEDYIKMVHSELQLGTLKKTGRIRCAGYADATWEHAPAKGPPMNGIVESKFSLQGNSNRDVHKFLEDVREASQTGRANLALYISLVDRVEGKPKISIEVVHGIPVMWAGRNVDDDISARSLIEMAFTTFAHVWAQIAMRDETDVDDVMKEVHAFVNQQIVECERMEAQLKIIEKATESIRTSTFHVRTSRDRMLGAAHQFRAKHDDVTGPVDNTIEHLVSEAVQNYYQDKKRYPKLVSDLSLNLAHGVSPETVALAFDNAVRVAKTASYKNAARKRKSDEDARE